MKIPAGVESGAKLKLAGMAPGAGGGDAYVELTVLPSPLFKRVGQDLELELPLSVSEAILGAEVRVPTVEGSVMMKVPAGVSSGQRLRIPGKGVPAAKPGGPRGDQYVLLKIRVPKAIDPEFKQATQAWTQRQPFEARQGWFGQRSGHQEENPRKGQT